MKSRSVVSLVTAVVFALGLPGCQHAGRDKDDAGATTRPALSMPDRIERDAGITYQTTGKIVIKGTEADIGTDKRIVIDQPETIQKIWDTIHQSRPYEVWYASGYRIVELYGNPNEPAKITLYVNESGATHTSKDGKRFRCPGLHDMIIRIQRQAFSAKPEPIETQRPKLPTTHTVAVGDSLALISKMYYGKPDQWQRIYNANRDVLRSPGMMRVGMRLVIPGVPD